MYKEPLTPELAVPVLRTKIPLTPKEPAFPVCKSNEPLLDEVPSPLVIVTMPPVAVEEVPADSTILPPDPLSPDPEEIRTEPPAPELAPPDPIYIAPLFPALELPVLSTNMPLTPEEPALTVCTSNAPLLDVEPKPLMIDTRPPVENDDVPADSTTSPPDPLLPEPTVT